MDTNLVTDFMPLANKMAHQKKRILPPFISFEELQSAAYLGLAEAASRYDSERGVAFSTFAYPRIFGAIHDYLREIGWHKKDGSKMYSLETSSNEDCCLGDTIEVQEEKSSGEFFDTVCFNFDNQAKSILCYYFIDDLSMKEVGEKFKVSESRISQLIKSYKDRIRNEWDESELKDLAA